MNSYSQAGQDLWVAAMTEGKTDGFYLDLGCNDAKVHNNTLALEELGWNGLLVDIVSGCESRKGTFVKCDAKCPDERLTFQYSQMPDVVDYMSLDVDDAMEGVLKAVPFANHTFRVITLEHDLYCRGPGPQIFSRRYLSALGYHLVCSNVMVIPPGSQWAEPYEDWWAWPELVNDDLIKKFQCHAKFWSDIVKSTT